MAEQQEKQEQVPVQTQPEPVKVSFENIKPTSLPFSQKYKCAKSSSGQVILGMIYKRKTGEWQRIVVDVSNWREKEEERLISLATITAQRAKDTGEVQYLYNLTPAQRRVIHLTLSENPGVSTESQGEGKDRYLAITPKG